ARRFAQLVEPFLLRRRKSDPGIAPELPAKTETDNVVGLTREQVVLYEALVRESMDRIERADEDTRRGLVLALLTGLTTCARPTGGSRAAPRSWTCATSCSARSSPRAVRCWSSRSTSRWRACS